MPRTCPHCHKELPPDDRQVLYLARAVAASRGQTLLEYLGEMLLPLVRADYAEMVRDSAPPIPRERSPKSPESLKGVTS